MVKFLDLPGQYLRIKDEIDAVMAKVLATGAFVGGTFLEQFERDFAAYQCAENCVGVANGTDALELVIEALQLPAKGEIIVPANTFIATAEAVTRMGYTAVFCDHDPRTYVIDIKDFQRKITPNTVAVIPVHLYGHVCDMDAVVAVAQKHGLKVIEDCSQAHGAEYNGRRAGTFGDAGTFSFYPGKNLGAYGDGGAVVTNSKELADRIRMLANHGRSSKFAHESVGRNSRLDGMQAAVLSVKLKHLDSWTNTRRSTADEYSRLLADVAQVTLPVAADWTKHVYHLYVIRTENPEGLKGFLAGRGIQTGIHYPVAVPKLKAYEGLCTPDMNMNACRMDSTLLSLPMGDHMTPAMVQEVADAVKAYFS